MLPCALDFRICSDSVRAARASFAALSQAVAVAPLSDALAERLQALAPGAQAAAGLLRFSYEAFRHGGVTIIEARLAPGDPYLDFIAALVAETPGLTARHDHGWPVLSQRPAREPDVWIGLDLVAGDGSAAVAARATSGAVRVFGPDEIAKAFAVDPGMLRLAMTVSDAVSRFREGRGQ